jgi:SAM-dependent methyltransferase
MNSGFLEEYAASAPLALALERAQECRMYARYCFLPPVLDLGCGDGLFASVLFSAPLDVGCDTDFTELSRAKARRTHLRLLRASALALPLPNESCRTVMANSVLEHIPDLTAVMREVHRLLRPGGRFYFTVPSSHFDRFSVGSRVLDGLGLCRSAARYRSFYNRFWRHYHYFSIQEWERVAAGCGFNVVESQSFDSAFLCTLNDLLVVFAAPAFLSRRFTGRWVLWPKLRKRWAVRLASLLRPLVFSSRNGKGEGGLVFLVLEKKGIDESHGCSSDIQ